MSVVVSGVPNLKLNVLVEAKPKLSRTDVTCVRTAASYSRSTANRWPASFGGPVTRRRFPSGW